MKRLLSAIFFLISIIGQTQTFQWAKQIGGTQDTQSRSITVDGFGNLYITGSFNGTVDFYSGPGVYNLTSTGITSNGDAFVCKFSPSGNLLWAKQMGGLGGEQGNSIVADELGNVYVTGLFESTADFDPGAGIFNLSSSSFGDQDIFVTKLDALGNFVWAKQMGGISQEVGISITLDASGNIYTTGGFNGTTDFDPGTNVFNLSSVGDYDIFVSKLDSLGNFAWAKGIGSTIHDQGASIVVDGLGYVYTTGHFKSTADFDPGPMTFNMTPAVGTQDVFVSKLDASGNFVWAKQMGVTGNSGGNSIILDGLGNVCVAGGFGGTVDFDPGPSTFNLTSSGSSDIFVSKLDAFGNFVWAKQMGGSNFDGVSSIVIDESDNIYTTGKFGGTADFDPGPSIFNLTSAGGSDIFVSKLDASGNFISARQMSGVGISNGFGTSIVLDQSNNIYTTGNFDAKIDFDPGVNTFTFTSMGNDDSFIHKMAWCSSEPSTPGLISGPASLCSDAVATYSIVSNVEAMGYTWSLSSGWSGSSTTNTILATAGSTGTFAVTASNDCGVSQQQTLAVTVDNTCTDVWPGDANSDGVVNNLDVLELGLHYTQIGTPRATIDNSWQSFHADNWTGTISNGKNLNHSDCNGDGIISDSDTLAIYINYGLTNAFKLTQATMINPQLSIIPDQTIVNKGKWGSASIFLGEQVNPITNINGIAYSVNYDNSLIENDSIYLKYNTSFLNPDNQNLNFKKRVFSNGVLYSATTHTDNVNVSGYGKIATLHYKVKSSLTTDETLSLSIVQAHRSNSSGSITLLTSGDTTLIAKGTSDPVEETLNNILISINPNPTNGKTVIISTTDLEKIEIINLTGQIIFTEGANSKSYELNLENVANGVYFVKVYNNNKLISVRKLVVNK